MTAAVFTWRGSVEHQYCARYLSGLHRAKRLVHVLEFSAPRDHTVEVEPSLLVELDDARHVDAEAVRSHEASLDALLEQQRETVDFDLLPKRNHPDNGRDTAGGDRFVGLLGRRLKPDSFERVIDAAAGQRANLLDRIAL